MPIVPVPALIINAPQVEKIDSVLTVEWKKKVIRPSDGALIFSGGVIAYYGVTKIYSDTLMLISKPATETTAARNEGTATGNVRIVDPEGEVKAAILTFNWITGIGHGEDIDLQTTGLRFTAKRLNLDSEKWTLEEVYATPTNDRNPALALRSPSVVIRNNQTGVADKPTFYVFGGKVITLPNYRFGKKQEATIRLPSLSYNNGLGIAWQNRFAVDDRTGLDAGLRSRRGEGPGVSLQLSRSLLPRNEAGASPPVSDLGERLADGYFNNVNVMRPLDELNSVGARRSSISVAASWNQAPAARRNRELFSKPFELIFENGRSFGEWGLYSQIRHQAIREEDGPTNSRTNAMGTLLFPSSQITTGLTSHVRIDGAAFMGNERFGWAQFQAGLVYRPFDRVRLGGAIVQGHEFGRHQFDADRLYSLRAYHFRLDTDLGSTKLSFLSKYDIERSKWYDNEIAVRQVAGSLEPYITYREFPRSFTFGVRMRLEDVFDRISRRARGESPKANDF